MNLLQSFKMAWRSIKGKRGRSVLTVLSIFIGIAAVMTIVSVMEGMKEYTRQQYAAMGSNKIDVSVYSWTYDEDGNNISKDYFPILEEYCKSLGDMVVGVTPNSRASGTVVYGTVNSANIEYKYDEETWELIQAPPQMYYASQQYSLVNEYEIARGRDLSYLDIEKYNQVCILGSMAAKTFFGNVDPLGRELQINGNKFQVIGIYKQKATAASQGYQANQMDNVIILPYSARRLLGGSVDNQFQIKVSKSEYIKDVISRVGPYMRNFIPENAGSVDAYSQSTWQEYETEQLSMIGLVLGGIAAISLIVGGIGIMNIMLVSVTERTKEIGIRRAIGARRSSIVSQFLIEAGMLCGMGGIVGIIVGTIGSLVLGKLMYKIVIWPSPIVTLGTFAFSVALGLLFGSYPASKASKLQPVEALRAE